LGKGTPDRGQSLLFHDFMQSWLGYELVKVLIAFGLQPTKLNASLEHRLPDLYNLFTYHVKSKKSDMAKNTSRLVNVLFNKTLHSGHWSKVKFGTMQGFDGRQNKTLTLVVLTWLRQLQQYFLQRPNNNNGDWSKLGKYCGTTANPLKNTAPLANINFSQYLQQQVSEQITHVKDFKPLENRDGVCTSLKEWALRILTPDEKFPLENLYNKDKKTRRCFDHAIQLLKKDTFEITNNNFTTTGTDSNDIENPDLKGLNTSVEIQQGVQTCDHIRMVNAVLLDCVNKAEKQKSQQRPWKKNELNNLKKVFDAASAMTAIVNWSPNNTETYNNFNDMHHCIAKKIASG
jgi:hypothetical protein